MPAAATTWWWWRGTSTAPFPRVEVFRRAVHDAPLHDLADPAAPLVAVVTDDATLNAA
jgi:hypothetical protein